MKKVSTEYFDKDKRFQPRRARLRNHRIEIKFVGHPIYQFRVVDVTANGAGILIKANSAFLDMIEKDQMIDVHFISPQGTNPSGMYSAKIEHITTPDKQKHKGHRLVGISLVKKLD